MASFSKTSNLLFLLFCNTPGYLSFDGNNKAHGLGGASEAVEGGHNHGLATAGDRVSGGSGARHHVRRAAVTPALFPKNVGHGGLCNLVSAWPRLGARPPTQGEEECSEPRAFWA